MCRKEKSEMKDGTLYEDFRSQIRPFDPVFFQGKDLMSKTIQILEKRGNNIPESGDFSHVGMVVTSDILEHPKVVKGKIYIWESILSGSFGNGVKDINGHCFFGTQIRDLDMLVPSYDKPNATRIAVGHLIQNPLDYMNINEVKEKFTKIFRIYDGKKYDMNMYSLFSSVFKCLRPWRRKIEKFCKTEEWLFCSEMVATVYKNMGIYPMYINEKDVLPRDIAFPQADIDMMPTVINNITYVVSALHYNKNNKEKIKNDNIPLNMIYI